MPPARNKTTIGRLPRGVRLKPDGTFVAHFRALGKDVTLGPFQSIAAAHTAYVNARKIVPVNPKTSGSLPYTFTKAQRELVRDLAGMGAPRDVICRHIKHPITGDPVGEALLKGAFKEELLEGQRALDLKLGRAMNTHLEGQAAEYLKDDEGNLVLQNGRPVKVRSEVYPSANFAQFMAKNKFGYTDRVEMEHTTNPESEIAEELRNFSHDEKRMLRDLLRRAREKRDSAAVENEAMTAPPLEITDATHGGGEAE